MPEDRICIVCKKYVKLSSPETGGQGTNEKGVFHFLCLFPTEAECPMCGQLVKNVK